MKKRLALGAVLAALCLSCCGCGLIERFFGEPNAIAAEPGLLETAAGVKEDSLAVLDGREISSRRCLYLLAECCDLQSAEGAVPDWDAPRAEGETLGEAVKWQALRTAALYTEIELLAERYDCALTDADIAAIGEQRTAAQEALGGAEAYEAALSRRGLTPADAEELAACYCLYRQLSALYAEPDSKLAEQGETGEDFDAFLQRRLDAAALRARPEYEELEVEPFYTALCGARAALAGGEAVSDPAAGTAPDAAASAPAGSAAS